jgi:hypothetical protein
MRSDSLDQATENTAPVLFQLLGPLACICAPPRRLCQLGDVVHYVLEWIGHESFRPLPGLRLDAACARQVRNGLARQACRPAGDCDDFGHGQISVIQKFQECVGASHAVSAFRLGNPIRARA